MVTLLRKFIGDPGEKAVEKIRQQVVPQINALEPEMQALSDEELAGQTERFRERLAAGETLDDLLPEAFATARETARRTLGQRHYDVQLIGGVALHRGQIAEMKTGEGKTLVATLPVYLNALAGQGVHVVTVNDYLARRDPVWMGPIYHHLGLTVGCLQHDAAFQFDPELTDAPNGMAGLKPVSRQDAYKCDVLYGTNSEFGFDYLRDNMAIESEQRVQRKLCYAIVDEVDNILIDEARTPLIINGPAAEPAQDYYNYAKLARRLEDDDYTVDDRTQAVSLTLEGIAKMERWTRVNNLYDPENFERVHYIENALTAEIQKQRDKDYVVQDGEVVIIDEFTGRLQFGRRWSDGLHQAVEAKENLRIQRESVTYATITLQNYFRMYDKLAGMTGTAATEADEFYKIYGLEVAVIPTNLEMVREDKPDQVFLNAEAKWRAAVEEIVSRYESRQPVLVGTASVEASLDLSERLQERGVRHEVLNATNHAREADIIAEAGRLSAVTVSTNMAGRGTDIVLGGSHDGPSTEEWQAKRDKGIDLSVIRVNSKGRTPEDWQAEHDKVVGLGGLHILGTERYDARRIDNQLRGRSGRQGDPGSSQFYVSLKDEVFQRFGGDRIKSMLDMTWPDKDEPIENKLISKSISGTQEKGEGYHFDIRKHLLNLDNVLNTQREIIYADRERILKGENLREKVVEMLRREFADRLRKYLPDRHGDNWDATGFLSELMLICPPPPELADEDAVSQWKPEEIAQILAEYAETVYAERERQLGAEQMRLLERLLLLRAIDLHWVNHLTVMENLRTGIGLHAYGQRDPLVMYRTEGHKSFQELLQRMQGDVVHSLFNVTITPAPTNGAANGTAAAPPRRRVPAAVSASPMQGVVGNGRNGVPVGTKIGRNAPCPCGSGRKYKRCCGANA